MARFAVVETGDPLETHAIVDTVAGARVALAPARGGLVTRYAIGDDEVLFLDDGTLHDASKNVRGGIPVLFPFAGRLTGDVWRDGDVVRAMGQHGFGRNAAWTVIEVTHDRVKLELEGDGPAGWPFRFCARLLVRLHEGGLSVALQVHNEGDRPMPIAPGFHPYFRVPDVDKAATRVVTDATAARDNRTGASVAIDGPIDLTAAEVDLHLADHHLPEARLVRPGRRDVAVRFTPGTLVVWTLAGRDFVCVEPWSAPADALNTGTATIVAPRGVAAFGFTISVA